MIPVEFRWLLEEGQPTDRIEGLVWGDGECECDLYVKGYAPYAWMKGRG